MFRIYNCFTRLKNAKQKGLVTYTMACDPNYSFSLEILHTLVKSGSDVLELGMPFSDPMADGKTIQKAAQRALKVKTNIPKVLKLVTDFRKKDNVTPIILMGYYNPIMQYGIETFIEDAKKAGADGTIIVDLPHEEQKMYSLLFEKNEFANINLLAPTTPKARQKTIVRNASGFVYFISVLGITGTKTVDLVNIKSHLSNIKKHCNVPVVTGFGIKTKEQAKNSAKYADAVVVGSAIIEKIAEYKSPSDKAPILKKLAAFTKGLKKALSD